MADEHRTGKTRWVEVKRTPEYIKERLQYEVVDFDSGAARWLDESWCGGRSTHYEERVRKADKEVAHGR